MLMRYYATVKASTRKVSFLNLVIQKKGNDLSSRDDLESYIRKKFPCRNFRYAFEC